MALSGLHVVCAFSGGRGHQLIPQDLMFQPRWSETLGTPSTTSKPVVDRMSNYGEPILRIYSAIDAWVSVAEKPDSSGATAPRFLVPAYTTYDVIVKPGDYLDWMAV